MTLINMSPVTKSLTGIGTMGYPMAINLRKKIPKESLLVISELNQEAVQRFLSETKDIGEVKVANTPREVGEQSVSVANLECLQ